MATKKPKRKPAKSSPRRRRIAARSKGLFKDMEPILGAVAGGVAANVIAKKIPIGASPNGEKLKSGAMLIGATILGAKTKSPMFKTILGGVAVGAGMQLVKQFMPTLLAGDDLGYTMPLGNEEQARIYAGLGYVQNLAGDDLLGDDLLGDDLLGDDLLGDENDLFGDEFDDLSGYSEISSQGVNF